MTSLNSESALASSDENTLIIKEELKTFVEQEVLPAIPVSVSDFWASFEDIFQRFSKRNAELIEKREVLQKQINDWHASEGNTVENVKEYKAFLYSIGYLVEEPDPFKITTTDVDPELATLAGPQLVVPVLNERYVLNAANARWGSLYDALYGTDALPLHGQEAKGYDPARGEQVIVWGKNFLDQHVPLLQGSHSDVDEYRVEGGVFLPALKAPEQFVGFDGDPSSPSKILLRHNGLHIELVVDRNHPVGGQDKAGVRDIVLESALSSIVDFEDSIAAVDAADKVAGYRNWLGLMKGDLKAEFHKSGKTQVRTLNKDRTYSSPDGSTIDLKARSLLLVRNVGHLMTTPAVLFADGSEVYEGILDAILTSTIACYDLKAGLNSKTGSIYIVKPKMHGPDECAFTNDLFDAVEDMLGLSRNTIKVGVMDEERRTSLNLAACIHAVKDRVVFINTGFLDRTGDEIHTSMHAGAMVRKNEMKSQGWISSYEARNVAVGLKCGFSGRAQIGKGMWAMPDRMADMLDQKVAHANTGANTAWVPSPTAATLHAVHYHEINVQERQVVVEKQDTPSIEEVLKVPLDGARPWSDAEIQQELENNAQGILGYVVRWVDQGVGCSKVPDINDIGLMEDRATLRISSQHIANWLMHGVCEPEKVEAAFERMAKKVDIQNQGDSDYQSMSPDFDGIAYKAALALVFEGANQPSGYTEPLLHAFRAQVKASAC